MSRSLAFSFIAALVAAGCTTLLGVDLDYHPVAGATGGSGGSGGSAQGGGSPAGSGGAGGATTSTGSGGAGGVGGPPPLVDGAEEVDHIAVNNTHVYWVANPEAAQAEVRRVPKAGGTPEPVLTQDNLKDLAVNDEVLVAASPNYVYRRPLQDPGVTTAQDWNETDIGAVTVSETKIYYIQLDYIREALHAATVTASFEPEDVSMTDIVAGPNFVYWTHSVGAKRLDHTNSVNSESLPSPPGLRMAVEGEHACWTTAEAGHIYCWSPGDTDPRQVPTTAGTVPIAIALFGGDVYWTEASTGRVARTLANGSGPAVELATGQPGPTSIAVDSSGVYWTNRTSGQVMHLPLP